MKFVLAFVLLIKTFIVYPQKKHSLTIISFKENSNIVDTLLKKEILNSQVPIDIFFTSEKLKLPYYTPTNGIFKNKVQEIECIVHAYKYSKCYKYDSQNRVIEMLVSGSGAIHHFTYKYNKNNQIIEIKDLSDSFIFTYNSDGMISEVTHLDFGVFSKKIIFIYE